MLLHKEIKMATITTTKAKRLLTALQTGQRMTSSQISKRFSIGNPSAEVSRIRQMGFAVYANKRVAGNNVEITEDRLGNPSRELVAAGYRALAMGV